MNPALEALIRGEWPPSIAHAIATTYGVEVASVQITERTFTRWTAEMDAVVLRDYAAYRGRTAELAERIGVTVSSMQSRARKLRVQRAKGNQMPENTKRLKVLVCGGRNYRDWDRVCEVLDAIEPKPLVIIHGDAPGADQLADKWATLRQVAVRRHPADWNELGRAAGPIRNQEMLEAEQPDVVIAFLGGRGTADMLSRAREAGIEVREISP